MYHSAWEACRVPGKTRVNLIWSSSLATNLSAALAPIQGRKNMVGPGIREKAFATGTMRVFGDESPKLPQSLLTNQTVLGVWLIDRFGVSTREALRSINRF